MTTREMYGYLYGRIGTVEGTLALLANLKAESGLKSTNMQNSYESKLGMNDDIYTLQVDEGIYKNFATDGVGYGLAQWTSSGRKANLYKYTCERGVSIGDAEMQLEFCIQELKTSYRKVWEYLISPPSLRDAVSYVLKYYERPKDQSETAVERRYKIALELEGELVKGGTNIFGERTCSISTIRKGSKGKLVKVWQAIVEAKVDGLFGKETEELTKDFQWSRGLVVDGIVGTKTWDMAISYLESL